MTTPLERRWRQIAALLVALELVACALDLWLGPFARVHWEERFNARSGVLFACGHAVDAFALQYRTFCGGCTAEALMAAPLFATFGSTHLVWKLVPEAFHVVVMGAGAWIAGRAAGGRSATAFAMLMMAAPGVYRELGHTGWGNHVEGPAFPLLAVVLLLAAHRRGWGAQLALLALAGMLTGLGLWFAHLTAHLLPCVALVALVAAPRALPAFIAAVPIGLSPWWWYHQSRPKAQDFAEGWMSSVEFAPVGRWVDWVVGEGMRDGLWDRVDYGHLGPLPDLWWFAACALATVAVTRAFRRLRHQRTPAATAGMVGPLGLLALLVAYWLRFDLWSNLPDPYGAPSFNLRYRVPMWPVMALALATPAGLLAGRRRQAWVLALGLLVGFGLWQRASLWQAPREAFFGLRVYAHDGWSDDTVPLGEPHQARKEAQGRPADLTAALDWLDVHPDPLPECRWSHIFELGRRLGVAVGDPNQQAGLTQDVSGALNNALLQAGPAAADQRYLAFGIAKGLAPTGEVSAEQGGAILDLLAPHGLDQSVGRELGALARERHHVTEDVATQSAIDARIWQGLCESRGQHAVGAASRLGEQVPDPLHIDAGLCGAKVWPGVGRAWGQWVGCTVRRADGLSQVAQANAAAAWPSYDEACLEHRGVTAPPR